jgi:hypothetical protein
MVEISGISGYDAGVTTNLIRNPDFELGDNGDWTVDFTAGSNAEITVDGDGNGQGVLIGDAAGEAFIEQDLDTTPLTVDVDFALSFNVDSVTNGTSTRLKVNDSGTYINDLIEVGDIGSTLAYTFTFALAETNLKVKFRVEDATDILLFTDVSLTVNEAGIPVYISSPLDHRRLFFGAEIYTPTRNVSNAGKADNSMKFKQVATSSSNYATKANSTRTDTFTIERQTDDLLEQLEHVNYQLNGDYCFYQRDTASTNERDYFIANFSIGAAQLDYTDINSTTITLQELSER